MVREALLIPLSVFWLRTSPKNFYQNFKNVNIPNKEIEYQSSYLSRWHVVAGKVNQGSFHSNRHCDVLVVTSRICNQPQKIHFDTPKKSRVFGLLVNSLNMSLFLTPEKLMKVTSQCFEMYKTEKVFILQFTKLIGLLSFNSTNSVTCTTSASVFTTNSGRIAQSRPFISTSSKLELQCKTGTSLVDPKLKTVQWKMSCTTPSTNGDWDGCFQNRFGSIMTGSSGS